MVPPSDLQHCKVCLGSPHSLQDQNFAWSISQQQEKFYKLAGMYSADSSSTAALVSESSGGLSGLLLLHNIVRLTGLAKPASI